MITATVGTREFWKHPELNDVPCAVMALRWIKEKKIVGEFFDKSEARPGDVLLFSGNDISLFFGPQWPWLIGICITKDRIAAVHEMEDCHGRSAFRLLLTRTFAIEHDGLIFRRGLRIE